MYLPMGAESNFPFIQYTVAKARKQDARVTHTSCNMQQTSWASQWP